MVVPIVKQMVKTGFHSQVQPIGSTRELYWPETIDFRFQIEPATVCNL